jgi:hypothetical protein
LVSRSELIVSVPRGSALRLIATEVFAFLAVAAAGRVLSILLMQEGALVSLVLGHDLGDPLLRMLTVDLEAFYLTRPLLSAAFIILAVAAILALFRDAFQSISAACQAPDERRAFGSKRHLCGP